MVMVRLLAFKIFIAVVFVLPIAFGLIGTWLPAFGYFPSIGRNSFSWQPLLSMLSHPSTVSSIETTVLTGLLSTFLAFLISQWLCMGLYQGSSWRWLNRFVGPLLAVPHLAFAIGLSFLLSPSGWIVRLISPSITGFVLPPDWLLVNDTLGLSLSLGLVLKEVPFFLLMSMAAMAGLNTDKTLQVAASLGYSHHQAWCKLIFPQIYSQLRLPIVAVLSYSLSVVDLSIVLGPVAPSTFSVLIIQWFGDADLNFRLLGAAGTVLLLVMLILSIGLLFMLEKILRSLAAEWLVYGAVKKKNWWCCFTSAWLARTSALFILLISLLSIVVLLINSFSQQWRFPNFLPSAWSLKYWIKSWHQLVEPLLNTAIIGFSSALIALVLSVVLLEWQSRSMTGQKKQKAAVSKRLLWLIYIPMLVPQVSFLFGIQVLVIGLGLEGNFAVLIWSHLLFVLPYSYLSLSQVYLRYDNRYLQLAEILSGSRLKSLFKIKLLMLLKPLAFSFAVGFSVSVTQYLPSLYVGAGRVSTLTLETVALATGSDDRVTSVFSLWQFALPLIVYILAIAIPRFYFRHCKGM